MIIAIDGPAAAGKGTLARQLAAHYGLAYLDTGALYRAVALAVLQAGADPAEPGAAIHAARALAPRGAPDAELRNAAVSQAASVVAAIPEVRAAILELQRRIAHAAPGAVLEGRDIGTVVCPDADVKLFLTATPEVRAARRWRERAPEGDPGDLASVLAEIEARDARDRTRATAPLRRAADAHLLDTTDLDIEAAFRKAVELIDRLTRGKGREE
jgi:cytidylate kinase